MGLDSFWSKSPTERVMDDITFTPELHLCGGIFSGNGAGSFRGKVYAHIIQAATGVSIYQEWIDNETIKRMTTALEAFPASDEDGDLQDLRRMFRAYADSGHGLVGWW